VVYQGFLQQNEHAIQPSSHSGGTITVTKSDNTQADVLRSYEHE